MRKTNWILFTIIILILLFTLATIKYNDGLLSFAMSFIQANPEIEIESYIEYGEHCVLAAHYPVFGLENIDYIIKDLIFTYILEFKYAFHDLSLLDTNYKSELNIDYELYLAPKNIVSVKFIVFQKLSGSSEAETFTETLIFDLSHDKQIRTMKSIQESFTEIIRNYKDNSLALVFSESKDMNMEIEARPVARKIDIRKPMVALTFDDGPYTRATIPILDTLKEHNTVATFFVLGNRIQNHKNIIKRIHEEGNELGNHTYNHKQLTKLPEKELKSQIEKTQNLILEIVGSEPKVMRPTYGTYDNRLRNRVNLPMILWSIDPMDWKVRDAEKIAQHILDRVKDGDIILMHDIFPSTAEAVEILIPELLNRGFQLVTVSELYESKGMALEVGNIYRHLKER